MGTAERMSVHLSPGPAVRPQGIGAGGCEVSAHLDQLRIAARLAQRSGRQAPPTKFGAAMQTARLFLRPVREQDRREFIRVLSENRLHLERFMPLHEPGERDDDVFLRQIAQCEAGDLTGKDWRRLIFDHAGRIVGGININDIRRGLENRANVTIWIAENAIGRGYSLEAMRAALDHAFRPTLGADGSLAAGLGLDCISAMVAPENVASVRLCRSLGFALVPANVPVELILCGRPASHDEWVLYARAPSSAARTAELRGIGSLPPRMRRDLKQIMLVECAARHEIL